MALKQTMAPAIEPVTLADAKAFLRVDTDAEDAFITSLITTARLQVETALDLALIEQEWTLAGVGPGKVAPLRLHPLAEVLSVMAIDDAGNASPVSADTVTTNLDVRPATVSVCPSPTQAQTLTIAFRAGFGATAEDVPAPIRHALLMLIAHWFENREPVSFGQSASRIPDAVSDLLKPYRAVRL